MKINAHATMIQTLVESQTPNLGLEAQPGVAAVSSKAKDLSDSNKIIFREEDPLSELPLKSFRMSLSKIKGPLVLIGLSVV